MYPPLIVITITVRNIMGWLRFTYVFAVPILILTTRSRYRTGVVRCPQRPRPLRRDLRCAAIGGIPCECEDCPVSACVAPPCPHLLTKETAITQVVGDRFCKNEAAALPRSCRSAGLGKSKLMIGCFGLHVHAAASATTAQDGSWADVSVEMPVPDRFSAKHWQDVEQQVCSCA
jgi:hypothetical protein